MKHLLKLYMVLAIISFIYMGCNNASHYDSHSATTTMATNEVKNTLHVPKQYKTINEAMNIAKAGDMILVEAGRYVERIQMKEGVILKSAGDDTLSDTLVYAGKKPLKRAELTVIDAGNQTDLPVVNGADGAVLDGFTITGLGKVNHHLPGHVHAVQNRGTSMNIKNNIIHTNGSTGIGSHRMEGKRAQALIENNFVYNNQGIGIGNNHGAECIIRNNVVFDNHEAGIGCKNGANPIIENNIVFNNGFGYENEEEQTIWPGIGCKLGANIKAFNNVVYGNASGGITVQVGSAMIVGNTVYENKKVGIGFRKGAAGLVENNKVYGNEGPGIAIKESPMITIINNTITSIDSFSIVVAKGTKCILKGNTITNQNRPAILAAGSEVYVFENTFNTKDMPGIKLSNCPYASMSNNTIKGNAKAWYEESDSTVQLFYNKVLK